MATSWTSLLKRAAFACKPAIFMRSPLGRAPQALIFPRSAIFNIRSDSSGDKSRSSINNRLTIVLGVPIWFHHQFSQMKSFSNQKANA